MGLLGGIAVTDAIGDQPGQGGRIAGVSQRPRCWTGNRRQKNLWNALLSRGATHLLDLVNRIVVRVCRVVPDLEDANRAIDDVAVPIELDVAL